jgi:hypothetical protein
MKPRDVAFGIVAVAAVGGFVVYRASVPPLPPPRVVVLFDSSGSSTGGCAALGGAVAELLGAVPFMRRSSLNVLATGDLASAGEPRELVRIAELASTRSIEGHRRIVRRREAIVASIMEKCGGLLPASISPIRMGVGRAIEDLRAQGCNAHSDCRLIVVGDLEENQDAALVARIRVRIPAIVITQIGPS